MASSVDESACILDAPDTTGTGGYESRYEWRAPLDSVGTRWKFRAAPRGTDEDPVLFLSYLGTCSVLACGDDVDYPDNLEAVVYYTPSMLEGTGSIDAITNQLASSLPSHPVFAALQQVTSGIPFVISVMGYRGDAVRFNLYISKV